MKIRDLLGLLIVFIFVFSLDVAIGQNTDKLFATLSDEDQKAMEALVLYPEETRNAIFKASTKPEVIIRLDALASETRTEFEQIIAAYSEEEQGTFWEISRFPDLLNNLSERNTLKKKELIELSADHPSEIRDIIPDLTTKELPTIKKINDLNMRYDEAFTKVLSAYEDVIKIAYRHIIEKPEIMEILSENLRLTILVGDNYLKDPEGSVSRADSIQNVVAQRNAEELEAWKKELEDDTLAREQLEKAAEEYANENGYRNNYKERIEVVHYYPYWFGHPRWHPYHSWHPNYYFSDLGFYYDTYGAMIIVGLPSYHFSWWFFHHPRYFYFYPHFAHHCFHHHLFYYHHHYDYYGMHTAISHWRNENDFVDPHWLADEENGLDRIREFGKFEQDRTDHNKEFPEHVVSREEFLEMNKTEYPSLQTRTAIKEQTSSKTVIKDQEMAPKTKAVKNNAAPVSKPTEKERRTYRAPDHHRRTWEKQSPVKITKPEQKAPSTAKPQGRSKDENRSRRK